MCLQIIKITFFIMKCKSRQTIRTYTLGTYNTKDHVVIIEFREK